MLDSRSQFIQEHNHVIERLGAMLAEFDIKVRSDQKLEGLDPLVPITYHLLVASRIVHGDMIAKDIAISRVSLMLQNYDVVIPSIADEIREALSPAPEEPLVPQWDAREWFFSLGKKPC
jgi:hypothetical protein